MRTTAYGRTVAVAAGADFARFVVSEKSDRERLTALGTS